MKVKVKNSGVVKLTARKDARRGDLFIAEAGKNVPFHIRRVYFVSNFRKNSLMRGGHAHKKTKQAIFCASGSFVLHLDDGRRKQKVLLNDPAQGIILGQRLWHTMGKFSKNCVVLVFASAHYNERDYIRDYDAFLKIVK